MTTRFAEVERRAAEDAGPLTRARLAADAAGRFVFGGAAVFTLLNRATGARITYEVERARPRPGEDAAGRPWFVRVLTGPENTADYAYLGAIWPGVAGEASPRYVHGGARSRIGPDAPSARGIAWLVARLARGADVAPLELWHEGRCCVCGRRLTTPESIAAGIGPVCGG